MTLFKFKVINFLLERVEKSHRHLKADNNSHWETHNPASTPEEIKDILYMGRDSTVRVQGMLLDQ